MDATGGWVVMLFVDRHDAGRRLAERLMGWKAEDPVVVGLPRGGIPVAAEVARALGAPLDVLVVRKLGCPWQPELGLGAIGEGGIRVVNEELVAALRIPPQVLEEVARREGGELARRVARYRGGRPPVPVDDRTVILVDDGIATGFTARAGAQVLRRRGARRVILAAPVAPPEAVDELREAADEVVVLETPTGFGAIGAWYLDFTQTTDDEVAQLLAGSTAKQANA